MKGAFGLRDGFEAGAQEQKLGRFVRGPKEPRQTVQPAVGDLVVQRVAVHLAEILLNLRPRYTEMDGNVVNGRRTPMFDLVVDETAGLVAESSDSANVERRGAFHDIGNGDFE